MPRWLAGATRSDVTRAASVCTTFFSSALFPHSKQKPALQRRWKRRWLVFHLRQKRLQLFTQRTLLSLVRVSNTPLQPTYLYPPLPPSDSFIDSLVWFGVGKEKISFFPFATNGIDCFGVSGHFLSYLIFRRFLFPLKFDLMLFPSGGRMEGVWISSLPGPLRVGRMVVGH